jgi:AsmA protein
LASGGVFKGGADIDIPDKFHGLKITARGVNIGGLLEALNKGRPAEGTADLDADINTRGESAKEFTASLNGTGLLEARDVRAAALASLSKTIPGLSLESFQLIRVPFAVRNGEVTAQPVTAVSRDIEIKGRAQAALPREHLDATATVHALGMNIPVFAKGPFNNLSYGLDAKFALPGLQQTSGTLSKTGKAAGGEVKKGTQKAKGLVKGLFGR